MYWLSFWKITYLFADLTTWHTEIISTSAEIQSALGWNSPVIKLPLAALQNTLVQKIKREEVPTPTPEISIKLIEKWYKGQEKEI